VDLAELSLGQRLKATESGLVNGADAGSSSSSASGSSSDEEEGTGPLAPGRRRRKGKASVNAADAGGAPVPASTLTRTLIQALHSADAGLLESCLAHSQPQLILASVARLPPQLALPLIDACVLRLGRGSRGSAVKGGGGGASAQRATALVAWVKAALAAHAGTLMGMPDAVARLAGLHAVMAQRAGMRGRLEGLMGRLDVVVSQVEMRGAGKRREGKAVGAIGKVTVQDKDKREVRRYVEGESSDEDDEDDEVDGVDVEVGSDAGSIEDVELGASDDSDDGGLDDDEEDDEEEDDSEEDGIGGRVNGFVDDEAEEYDEDSDASDSD
jgi:U3 small nucleolar RNA-associated protein 5